MKKRPGEPGIPLGRFSDADGAESAGAGLPLESDAVDARIGALLRRVPEPAPLSEARLARVAAGLALGPRRARGRWRAALVALVVMGASGAVYARHEIRAVVANAVEYARTAVRPARRSAPHAAESPRVQSEAARAVTAPAEAPAAPATDAIAAGPASPDESRAGTRLAPGKAAPRTSRTEAPRTSRAEAPRTPPRLALASPTRPARVSRPPAATPPAPPALAAPAPAAAPALTAPALTPPAIAPPPLPAAGPAPHYAPAVAARPPGRRDTPALPPPDTSGLPLIGPPPPEAPLYRPAARLGDEAALLREALASLRHDADPEAALAALDQYQRRFPHGVLRPNADLVRIDTLVALRRRDEALALLDRLDWRTTPRADDLQITRGELRAVGDCDAATADFTAALARKLPPALAERALRGRAACALAAGDRARAEADLRAYLSRFPATPFAAKARAQLGAR